jgi:hypothetical protein
LTLLCRFSTWEPEENILDPRLIHQFVQKEASKILQAADNSAAKRGRKTAKPDAAAAAPKEAAGKDGGGGGGRKRTKSVSREVKEGEEESSEEEKEEESPKPAFLMQTLSGRNPKPPKRWVGGPRHRLNYMEVDLQGLCGLHVT